MTIIKPHHILSALIAVGVSASAAHAGAGAVAAVTVVIAVPGSEAHTDRLCDELARASAPPRPPGPTIERGVVLVRRFPDGGA